MTTIIAKRADTEPKAIADGDGVMLEDRVYLGSLTRAQRGPQAFAVTFPGNYLLRAHFHLCDQFQIFVAGHPRLGRQEIAPVTLQYVDSSTAYGPIQVGDDGMTFFNFRAYSDIGAYYMPESRVQMQHERGRSIVSRCRLAIADEVSVGLVRSTYLVEPHTDGLLALETVAGPGVPLMQEMVVGSGRYQLVLDGSMTVDGDEVVQWDVAFVAAGRPLPQRVAGPRGVHVMEMQLPAV